MAEIRSRRQPGIRHHAGHEGWAHPRPHERLADGFSRWRPAGAIGRGVATVVAAGVPGLR